MVIRSLCLRCIPFVLMVKNGGSSHAGRTRDFAVYYNRQQLHIFAPKLRASNLAVSPLYICHWPKPARLWRNLRIRKSRALAQKNVRGRSCAIHRTVQHFQHCVRDSTQSYTRCMTSKRAQASDADWDLSQAPNRDQPRCRHYSTGTLRDHRHQRHAVRHRRHGPSAARQPP